MHKVNKLLTLFCLFSIFALPFQGVAALSDGTYGNLRGEVKEKATGEPLPGANVVILGTSRGAATNQEGAFVIRRLHPGTYRVAVTMIGYKKAVLDSVLVTAGETTWLRIELSLEPIMTRDVVVEAQALRDAEGALLRDRKQSATLSDAIGHEKMAALGLNNAATAMARVPGASVFAGKYVYVRGLGGRYASTSLNHVELPSSDPDRKAVHLDLFPVDFLDNIVVSKTLSPDKPANFTGGAVNLNTRSFPGGFSIKFSTSFAYTPSTTFSNRFLTYPGGKRDWLGMDDGTRALPALLQRGNVTIPDIGSAWTRPQQAQLLDQISRAFVPVMAPRYQTAGPDQSYKLYVADQMRLLGRPLGMIFSGKYAHSFQLYQDGVVARYQLTGNVNQVQDLTNDFLLRDEKGREEVVWGGLANLSYKLSPSHDITLQILKVHSGENEARYLYGAFPRDLADNAVYETRVLKYVQRDVASLQLSGKKQLGSHPESYLNWRVAKTRSQQDEPDLRYFTNNYTLVERNGHVDTVYAIRPSIYPVPTRYFRNLAEENRQASVDLQWRLAEWYDSPVRLKFGYSYLRKDRTFRERRFEYRQDAVKYDGDPERFFSADNIGILESARTTSFTRFGNYIVDVSQLAANYDGEQSVAAGYMMVELPLLRRLRAITGIRVERTHIQVASLDTTKARGLLQVTDRLPSLNLVYEIHNGMNLRLAAARSLARPNFRELAPYASFDFVGDYIFVGNPHLKRTLVSNYDLRWEWFPGPGEVLAISGYYKYFTNPIERAINPRAAAANPEIQYRNVDNARVFGVELEISKRLAGLASFLDGVQLGGNLSFIHSEVAIAPQELEALRSFDADAPATRPMQGQPGYLLNLFLSYDRQTAGTTFTISLNTFGPRLAEVGMLGTPDIYESPRTQLDFTLTRRLVQRLKLNIQAKNVLNAPFRKIHELKGRQYDVEKYRLGRHISIGLSYIFQ